MPVIGYDHKGRVRVIHRMEQISKMPMRDLIVLESFLWQCMKTKIPQPAVVDYLNAIHREVEWRAQDTEFQS